MPIQEFESRHFDVEFVEDDAFVCSLDEGDTFEVTFGSGIEKEYQGPYEFTPTTETQTVHTTDRVLTDEIVIDPIPNCYGLISWDGSTLTVS